jgi:hypothetical protein
VLTKWDLDKLSTLERVLKTHINEFLAQKRIKVSLSIYNENHNGIQGQKEKGNDGKGRKGSECLPGSEEDKS